MVFTCPFLTRINNRNQAPLDCYILYDLNGGIYTVEIAHYSDFLLQWVAIKSPPSFTLDLAFASPHSLILDFDCVQEEDNNRTILETVFPLLKRALLPTVPHFTYLVCTRKQGKGLHIHLPEFKIGHDDYILFCKHLREMFELVRKDYKLDILANAMLAGAAKPDTHPYVPVRVVYADERHNTHQLDLVGWKEKIETLRKAFSKRKDNENSLFRNLLNSDFTLLLTELKQLMMPVTVSSTYNLAYPTTIGRTLSVDADTVAQFLLHHTEDIQSITKSKKLVSSPLQKAYHYLKHNAPNMAYCETNNHAIKMWYARFSQSTADDSHIPPFFRDMHKLLQFEHMTLAENPNPIKTIMQFNRGYYFLPVFYALCAHYARDSRWMAEQMRELLDVDFYPLLDRIAAVSPKNVQFAVSEISLNSIHFCANNLHETAPTTYREKLKSIVDNNRRAILSVSTHDQMVQLLRNIQDRHLPIRMLKMKNALKRPNRHIWNALTESWQEIGMVSEVSDHMTNLWSYVKQSVREYWDSGGRGGPDADLVSKFNVAAVVSAIMSDTAMEQKNIQMDTHKWFLRLEEGVLDLLTGHIGGGVPEFYISNRTLQLGIPRLRMMELCNDAPRLVDLYERLTDKRFFMQYLKSLFLDRTDSLLDTLDSWANVGEDDALARSMLHFYVNLCKCTCFEYELMMYMLDVLASVFVGTNYERKFFVWKGLTRNGKSKLFELMGRVLGGYYHSIQSENLSPSNTSNNATPELASTLFSCRMVTSEELEKRLDENRVKQITGNSFVAFRNMYEQNTGGIPTAKLFATTNHYPECKASEAFKDRVVAIPFDAEFSDTAPSTTSEQVAKNTFAKDVYVVEQSYRGCFLMLYYHFRKHANPDDALLHYRDEPECVEEFTHDYLIHADIYVQFKLHMDVQLLSGYVTSMNDVKSAVRQYLKTTRNTSFHETDLFICFEKEFGDLRKTDVYLGSGGYTSIVDEPKKPKYDASVVFYDGVVIKNLKRIVLDS